MEGLEWSFGSVSTSTQKQAEAQGQVLFTDSASQVWKEPVLPCTEYSAKPSCEELLLPKGRFESPAMFKMTFQAISAGL